MDDDITQEPASSPDHEPPARTSPPVVRAELWLVGINAGTALAIAAVVAALTQAGGPTAVRDVMWTLAVMGICILLLCVAGYLSQRRP
jgi:hypothetical protein